MSTPLQYRPTHGRALAAILAVAASVSFLAAQDHSPANGESAPAASAVGGSSAPVPANGTLNSVNATQLPAETDIAQLQRFLSMPPERLEQMRKAIEYLENMPPGELVALRLRMHSIQELSQEIRGDIRELPKPEDRSILGRYLMTLYPEDVQPLLKGLQEAKDKPEARKQIIQGMLKKAVANGIKPDPRATDRGTLGSGARGGNRGRGANAQAGSPAAVQPATSSN